MATSEKSRGIFPTDIVLRSVLKLELDRLRARPYLLDDVFAALDDDEETRALYGKRQADAAKEWFLHQDVPIRISDSPEPPSATSVILQMAGGQEDALTLADVHYLPTDADDRVWPVLAGPLDPLSHDPATGLVVLPPAVTLVPAAGMLVVDREGRELPVLASPATRSLLIAPGAADLRDMTIRGAHPTRAVTLGSLVDQESYLVAVCAHGEAVYLSYLFAIVKYALLRARLSLETRGIERVRYSYQPVEWDASYGVQETMWSRGINVTMYVRQTWVQDETDRVYTVQPQVLAQPVGGLDLEVDVLSGVVSR